MNSTIDWREENGVVTISQPGPGLARLFGVPFLAIGGYLFYQFFDGLIHPGELTIAGWTLLPILAAASLVPGWLIVMFRKRTIVDAGRREACEEYDFRLYTRRTRTAIPATAHVMLRYEKGSERSTGGASFWIHVYLESGNRLVLVALFRDGEKTRAVAFAQRLAALLSIDVRDRMVEQGDVTSGGVVVSASENEDAD